MGTGRAAPTPASLVITWWAVFGSLGMFIAVLTLVERPVALQQPELLPLFALLAASTCVAALILPARIFAQAVKSQRFDALETPDPQQPVGFGSSVKVAREPERAKAQLLGLYATKTILGAALGESVSLLGLVLGFLGAPVALCIPFFVAGALVQLFHYPRVSAMLATASSITGIRFST